MKLKITLIALFALTISAFSQPSVGTGTSPANGYTTYLIPLPTATLAAAGSTNFYNGWSSTTIFTNTYVLYTNINNAGNPGFITNTVYTTNTSSVYPSVYFPKQERLAFEYRGVGSGGATATNGQVQFTFAKSVTGRSGQADTSQQFTWNLLINQSTNNTIAVTNFSADFLGGEGYVFLIQQTWLGTNVLTNVDGGIYVGFKPNAP